MAALVLTSNQRKQWLAAITLNPTIGNRAVLTKLGVTVDREYTAAHGHKRTKQAPPSAAEIDMLLASDSDLRDEYERARGRHHDQLEAEAIRRGVDGVDEPVYTPSGKLAGMKRVYSDRLLLAVLKARHPAYRDTRHLELTGPNGGPVVIEHEKRLTLGDLHDFALTLPGLGSSPRGELPTARPILAQPKPGQPPTGDVPS